MIVKISLDGADICEKLGNWVDKVTRVYMMAQNGGWGKVSDISKGLGDDQGLVRRDCGYLKRNYRLDL